jgi:hypothetical protein
VNEAEMVWEVGGATGPPPEHPMRRMRDKMAVSRNGFRIAGLPGFTAINVYYTSIKRERKNRLTELINTGANQHERS